MSRLSAEELARNFSDLEPPYSDLEAVTEAARCLYCYDAPCTRACPTHIDVPKFIRQILHRNPLAAARTIWSDNILGGSCARACPVEVLCEGACVDHTLVQAPVKIGRLQRYACDAARSKDIRFFEPGPDTGKRIVIVGSGPASLACAHELRKHGHQVTLHEAKDVPGGLNSVGIAAYKITREFALTEVDLVQQLGVDIRLNSPVAPAQIGPWLHEYDAVFLGLGLGKTLSLGIEGEDLPGVWEALDFIAQTHEKPLTECQVGRNVVVIGAGNTAVDVATAAARLGAGRVTMAYRRGPEAMPAFAYEYELAKSDGIEFEWLAAPVRILGQGGRVSGIEFVRTELADAGDRAAKVSPVPGSEFVLPADMVVMALGQQKLDAFTGGIEGLKLDRGRIAVEPATMQTSVPKLFAGGDCVNGGAEIVDAVQHGKLAAAAIDALLSSEGETADGR
ncbi:MAG: NAD(P)-dependent oxidoreductase [Planctomycetes bacterium]|nr:NAD(P)-dependent oxidoreductase [Planctomycetota bacterium]